MDRIKYRLTDRSKLLPEERGAVVQSDHNMTQVEIAIPQRFKGVSLVGFSFMIRAETQNGYDEIDPGVAVTEDTIRLTFPLTERLTQEDRLVFSIAASLGEERRFHSGKAEIRIGDTIRPGKFFDLPLLDRYLEEIKEAVQKAKRDIAESLEDKVDDYIATMDLSYTVLADKPMIEGVTLEDNKRLVDLGLEPMTMEDLDRLF